MIFITILFKWVHSSGPLFLSICVNSYKKFFSSLEPLLYYIEVIIPCDEATIKFKLVWLASLTQPLVKSIATVEKGLRNPFYTSTSSLPPSPNFWGNNAI